MNRYSLSNRSFLIAFASWWTVWTALHCLVLLYYNIEFSNALVDSVVSNILISACCILINNNLSYYLPRYEKYWYILIISLCLTFIAVFIPKYVLLLLFNNDTVYKNLLQQSVIIRFAISFLLIGCMGLMSMLWHTLQEQKETEQRQQEAEKMTKEAELFKLRQQLQPHFLFNSLNSISALIGSKPEQARHMIYQLSDFLRGTLKREEHQWNSLKEELQYLWLYLDIEKVRFGHRLKTKVECAEEAQELKLPSLLLQPIVENAIKFGLYDTIDDVEITIDALVGNGDLVIEVKNPFDAETAQPLSGTGFGLASVKRRLYLLFGRHDLLKTEAKDDIFTIKVTIPQIVSQPVNI
ncbi:MAG: sensor histidine kinase [Ilyomonas sp.]